MGPYRHDEPLPTKEDVCEWLRRRITKPLPSRWRRLLGEPTSYRYEIDAPVPWVNELFGSYRLFTVHAREPGLLPLPRWEGERVESWGIFAVGPAGLELLAPGTGSLTRLLRAEGRSLDQGSLHALVELVCALELGEGPEIHTVVTQVPTLHRGEGLMLGWCAVDDVIMMLHGGDLVLPSIEPMLQGGWEVRFSTLVRSHAQPVELGTELLYVSPDFAFHRHRREVVATWRQQDLAAVIVNPARIDDPGPKE